MDLEISNIVNSLNDIDKRINNLDLKISRTANNYTDSNPLFLNLKGQRDTLDNQKESILSQIKKLPVAQQEYIDLFRNLELTERVYEELMNRRLEFSIKEASTLGNIRIVDEAYFDSIVEPQPILALFTFGFFVLLSLVVVIIRGIYFLPLSNPAELADAKIKLPIIGVVPNIDGTADIQEDERFNQALQSLLVNVDTLLDSKKTDSCKILLLTSSSPENGKSFVSRNIAKKLSATGSKVLLVDADLKRGDQRAEFIDLPKITLNEFLELNENNLKKFQVDEKLIVIPKISGQNDSFNFIYDGRYTKKLDELKNHFNHIVIDTPPILSVSDTLLLMAYADLNIGVVRHGVNKINEIKQMIDLGSQSGCIFDGAVYNAYEKPSSYYGYYGLYGNYSYQYYAQKYLYENYDYKKNNE